MYLIGIFVINEFELCFARDFPLLVTKMLILEFSMEFMFLVGLGCFLTGVIRAEIVPHTLISGVACFTLSSDFISADLYESLKFVRQWQVNIILIQMKLEFFEIIKPRDDNGEYTIY